MAFHLPYEIEYEGRRYFGNVSLRAFHLFDRDGQAYVVVADAVTAQPISPRLASIIGGVALRGGGLIPAPVMRELRALKLVAGEEGAPSQSPAPPRADISGPALRMSPPGLAPAASQEAAAYTGMALSALVGFTVYGLVLFLSAGTIHWAGAWVYLFLASGPWLLFGKLLIKHDPRLVAERMSFPMQKRQEGWDKAFVPVFYLSMVAWLALMGLEVRSGARGMPPLVQCLGAAGILQGMAMMCWGLWWNTFASTVVKVQPGHRVIDTGPYRYVRHPMYAGWVTYALGTPLLLGSRQGLVAAPLFIGAMALRAVLEERALKAKLPGYEEYMGRVKYRLVPGVW